MKINNTLKFPQRALIFGEITPLIMIKIIVYLDF